MSLRSMFAGVVKTYDFLNRIITFGLDNMWRKSCAKECTSGNVVLDLCCGTGDLALYIAEYATPETQVVGLDFNKGMLWKALNKRAMAGRKHGKIYNVSFILADAAHLPFKEGCFDRIGISFSFLNLIYKNPLAKAYLKAVLRILDTRGKFVCVETSQPGFRPLRILYHLYLRKVVSFIGGLVSGRKDAYRYLGRSAINFPPGEKIVEMLLSTGFRKALFQPMTFGAVGLYEGIK